MGCEPELFIGRTCDLPGCAASASGRRARGRVATTLEDLQLFAQSLGPGDRVALEVTGNAWEIARIIEPHVARVIVVSPGDTGIRQARAKTDRLDAVALAKLLAAGSLDAVWVPEERIRVMRRRLARRRQPVAACTPDATTAPAEACTSAKAAAPSPSNCASAVDGRASEPRADGQRAAGSHAGTAEASAPLLVLVLSGAGGSCG